MAGPFNGVANLMFSPDKPMAVTTGAELRIIDPRSGGVLRTFPGTGGFWVAVFARDSRWISAMTGSGLVELFDIESGARVGVPLRVADDAISDGRRGVIVSKGLYWGGPNGTVVYYDLDPASWADIVCRAAGRNLTRAEWDQYLGSLGRVPGHVPAVPRGLGTSSGRAPGVGQARAVPLAAGDEDVFQHGRPVRHDPVGAEVEQAGDLDRVVDRPDVHLQARVDGTRRRTGDP